MWARAVVWFGLDPEQARALTMPQYAALAAAYRERLQFFDSLQASISYTTYACAAGRKRRLKPKDFLLLR